MQRIYKKGMLFTLIFRLMGIIVLMIGLRMIGEGIYNYINEHDQDDWLTTTAYVVGSTSEYSSQNRNVYYDITYQYDVGENNYTNILYNRIQWMEPGDKVKIKYDPDAPDKSTEILKPSLNNLIVFLAFGTIFSIIGYFLSGAWSLVKKIRHRGEPKEAEILPPEEYIETNETDNKLKNPILLVIGRITIIVIYIYCILYLIKLFS